MLSTCMAFLLRAAHMSPMHMVNEQGCYIRIPPMRAVCMSSLIRDADGNEAV